MTSVPSRAGSDAGGKPASVIGGQLARIGRLIDPVAKGSAAEADPAGPAPVPARIIAMGIAGVLLIAGGGIGAAKVLEADPLLNGTAFGWLGYGHGKQMATAVVFVGIALLVVAWIRLGRDVHAGRVDRRGMLIAIGMWALPLLFAPPLFSRDLFSYLAQGDLALHGYDPYQYGVSVLNDHLSANVDPAWQNTPAPYGPLFILVAKVVVLITGQSTIVGVVAMRMTMCVGLVLLCWALPRLAERLGGRPIATLWFGAANPFVLLYLVGGGHNDLLMVGLLASGTVLVLDAKYRRGFLLVTLAFAVKATAGVLLPFLVWIWAARLDDDKATGKDEDNGKSKDNALATERLTTDAATAEVVKDACDDTRKGNMTGRRFARAAAGGAVIVVATFAVCSVLAGVGLGWIPALGASSAVIEWLSLPTAVGQLSHTIASLFRAVDPQGFLAVARSIGWLVLVVLVLRQWWLARDGAPVPTVRRAVIALLVVTLFAPATLPWYFSWPLVLAAGLAWSGRALVVGTFCSVWIVLVTFPDGTTGLYDWAYLATAMLAAGLAAVSLIRPDPLRLRRDSTAASIANASPTTASPAPTTFGAA